VLNFSYVTPVNCEIKSTDIQVLLFYDFTCGIFFFLIFHLIFCVLAVIICKNMAISFTIFCSTFLQFTDHGTGYLWSLKWGNGYLTYLCRHLEFKLCDIYCSKRFYAYFENSTKQRQLTKSVVICIHFMNLLTLFSLEIYRLQNISLLKIPGV